VAELTESRRMSWCRLLAYWLTAKLKLSMKAGVHKAAVEMVPAGMNSPTVESNHSKNHVAVVEILTFNSRVNPRTRSKFFLLVADLR